MHSNNDRGTEDLELPEEGNLLVVLPFTIQISPLLLSVISLIYTYPFLAKWGLDLTSLNMSIWRDGGFVFRIRMAGGVVVMRRGGKWPASKRLFYLLIRLGP